jgi:uncharacterized protein YjbI with pentapeptide repeats
MKYEDLIYKYKLASNLYSEVKDFRGRYFSDIVFDIEGVDLSGVVLYKCYCPHKTSALEIEPLYGIRDISLENVNFSHQTISKADFQEGRFVSCDFDSAIVSSSNLRGTMFSNITFENIQFLTSDLDYSVFKDCSFHKGYTRNYDELINEAKKSSFKSAQFKGDELSAFGFKNCDMQNSVFQYRSIDSCSFRYCDLYNMRMIVKESLHMADFGHANLKKAYIEVQRNTISFLKNSSFNYCNLLNTEFGERVRQCLLEGSYLNRSLFSNSLMSENNKDFLDLYDGITLVGPNQDFTNTYVSFEGKDISGVNLENSNFCALELSETNFQKCNLQNVDFRNAELDYAEFQGADLRGADLRGANLNKTEYDRSTRLPDTITKEQLDSMLFMEDED